MHTQYVENVFPPGFAPLAGSRTDCEDCARGERLDFQFDYAFQPIVDVNARTVFAYKAVVRGPSGEGAASILANVGESNRYRFDQVCRVKAIKGASALGMTVPLSINFMPNAIYNPELCIRTTLEAARTYGFPVENIIFEVTEGERIEDGPWFAEILKEYQRLGFKTAIDDFGAGFAGLKLLPDFQPDIVKIDMDLVRNVDKNRARQAIVKNIVRLCSDLGIQAIAEGIETPPKREFLRDAGISIIQGCLFARPMFKSLALGEPAGFA